MSDPVVLLSTGDVVGPAGGVTDNSMVLFSGTSGKLIKGNNAQVTAAGLALLDDIDANAQLTTLGLTTTQPQFDNSVKQATTEFVQRTLGNLSGQVSYSVNATLTAGDVGKRAVVLAPITLTLPLLSSVANGSRIYIRNSSVGNTIVQRQGSDAISTMSAAGLTSLTTQPATLAVFVAGSNAWAVEEGDVALTGSALFRASLAASGYQKLPSGLIAQWGRGTASSGGNITVSYPIAFPNAVLSVQANSYEATSSFSSVSNISSLSQFTYSAYSDNGARVGTNFTWIAIGY